MKVKAIDNVVFNVRDVEIFAAWYEKALGMERQVSCSNDGSTRTSMTFGSNKIIYGRCPPRRKHGLPPAHLSPAATISAS